MEILKKRLISGVFMDYQGDGGQAAILPELHAAIIKRLAHGSLRAFHHPVIAILVDSQDAAEAR